MRAVRNAIVTASFASLALAHPRHSKRGIPADGTIWTSCTTPGVVALTFDDGPYMYTQEIVDQLTAAGHRATFFQNGQNWDSIYNYNATLQSMIAGGHQVASHTWSHADLATLTADQITNEMMELEAAHLAIIGKAPRYMRPPYLSTNSLAISTLKALDYLIIEVDVDTQDWAEAPLGEIQLSIDWYEGNQTAGGTLSLNHDPYQPTAETFIPAIISYLSGKGLKSVPVGECLGDDPANWYRSGSTTSSSAPASSPTSSSAGPSGSGSPSSTGMGSGPTSSGSPTKGSGYPGGSPTGSGSSWTPKGTPRGGDTEPGHGPNAGRGALPGHAGEGNNGCAPGAGNSTGGSSGGSSGGYGGSPSYQGHGGTNTTGASPAYYSNGATGLTGSVVVMGAALLAIFL